MVIQFKDRVSELRELDEMVNSCDWEGPFEDDINKRDMEEIEKYERILLEHQEAVAEYEKKKGNLEERAESEEKFAKSEKS